MKDDVFTCQGHDRPNEQTSDWWMISDGCCCVVFFHASWQTATSAVRILFVLMLVCLPLTGSIMHKVWREAGEHGKSLYCFTCSTSASVVRSWTSRSVARRRRCSAPQCSTHVLVDIAGVDVPWFSAWSLFLATKCIVDNMLDAGWTRRLVVFCLFVFLADFSWQMQLNLLLPHLVWFSFDLALVDY